MLNSSLGILRVVNCNLTLKMELLLKKTEYWWVPSYTSSSGNWLWKAPKAGFNLNSGRNKVFLIDLLFQRTLKRIAGNAVVYSWKSGGTVSPWVQCKALVLIKRDAPGNFFFLLIPKNRRKLAHRKNESLIKSYFALWLQQIGLLYIELKTLPSFMKNMYLLIFL